MVLSSLRALAVALALVVAFPLTARADSHHLRAQGGAGDTLPGKQYRTVIDAQFPNAGHLMKGAVVQSQLRRMDRMVLRPGTVATRGEWISKHFGNGVARPGESYPTEIAGVWDPVREVFQGFHVTAFHEVVTVSIDAKRGTYVARKEGGPVIGAARHASPGTPVQTMMRTWGTSSSSRLAHRLATEAGLPNAESVAYEITLDDKMHRSSRTHVILNEKSGLVDQRANYDVWIDPHTGAKTFVTETNGGPKLDVQDAGKDPWRPFGTAPSQLKATTRRLGTIPVP